jgi:hypothetical protein
MPKEITSVSDCNSLLNDRETEFRLVRNESELLLRSRRYYLTRSIVLACIAAGLASSIFIHNSTLIFALTLPPGIYIGLTKRKKTLERFISETPDLSAGMINGQMCLGERAKLLAAIDAFDADQETAIENENKQLQMRQRDEAKKIAQKSKKAKLKALADLFESRNGKLEQADFKVQNSIGFSGETDSSFTLVWESFKKPSDEQVGFLDISRKPQDAEGFHLVFGDLILTANEIVSLTYQHNQKIDRDAASRLIGFETSTNEIANAMMKVQGMGDLGLSRSETQAVYKSNNEEGRDIYDVTIELRDGAILAGQSVFQYDGNDTEDVNNQLLSILYLIWSDIDLRCYKVELSERVEKEATALLKEKALKAELERLKESIKSDAGKNASHRFRKLKLVSDLLESVSRI